MVWVLSFLDSFGLWHGLLESFLGYSLKESGQKHQGGSYGFGVVDEGS